MHRHDSRIIRIAFLTFVVLAALPLIAADEPYHLLKEIPVGGDGGWDCLSVDQGTHRLYVPHASKVIVIDLAEDKVVGEVGDTPGVHDFEVAPDTGKGYSSNGRENKVSMVDLKTLKTISKVPAGESPDVELYEPSQKEIYVFNGRGQSATVLAGDSGKVVTTVTLPGKPEFAAVDPKAGQVYINLEDKSQVGVIDVKTHQVVKTWPIAPGEEASGMAFDSKNHRLFLACGNKMMVMMDSSSGNVVTTAPIGGRVDGAAFDPETQLAFIPSGEGNVTIVHEDSPDKVSVVQSLKTETGARTMALDPVTHKIYLPSAKFEPQAAQTPGGQRQRPKMVPDTFKVLVYGMSK